MCEFEKIKCVYIVEIIFNHLEDNKKLNIMKYNKYLQDRLNIDIDDYKKVSGRYITYVGNEYDTTNKKLLYIGEYMNGERNGKGKEFDGKGNLIYFGKFKNGKRHGKGREFSDINRKLTLHSDGLYYNMGEKVFEGEFKNGKKNGKGEEYYKGKLIFKGVYLNGKRNGKGTEF